MGELSFLLEILLNHKLAKPTKDLIAARIRELEDLIKIDKVIIPPMQSSAPIPPQTIGQQIALQRMETSTIPDPALQNSAVQQALAARQAIMSGGGDKSMFKVKPKPAPK